MSLEVSEIFMSIRRRKNMCAALNEKRSTLTQGICPACEQTCEMLFGYHCINHWNDKKDSCEPTDHTTYLCEDCFGAMFSDNPPEEKPVIIVNTAHADPCRRFEYLLRADLEANRYGERNRIEKIRALHNSGQQKYLNQQLSAPTQAQEEMPQSTLAETSCE
jgi:hypothetical protein